MNALPVWRDTLLQGGLGNPFVHLRRGQALFELGDLSEAQNELARALLLGGQPLFADEASEYWAFIIGRMRPYAERGTWEGWTGVEDGSPMAEWLVDPGHYDLRLPPQD